MSLTNAFARIKYALKARKMTYGDLAKALGLSEPTVKRLFIEQDCKLSRLVEICQVLEIEPTDILGDGGEQSAVPKPLPLVVENQLAKNKPLFYLLLLLMNKYDAKDIMGIYDLSTNDMYQYLRVLEKLELLELGEELTFKLTFHQPVLWRKNGGPLHAIIRNLNLQFAASIINDSDADENHYANISRRMRAETFEILTTELDSLLRRIRHLAEVDQLIYPDEQLKPYKLLFASGPISFPKFSNIPAPFSAENETAKIRLVKAKRA